jgi:CheY-like chemotaxis protein
MIRVLIIDDNQHMIYVVRTILKGVGITRVWEANDAVEGFQILKDVEIDIIIVDYSMDVLDGADFIKLVRTASDSPNPFIPIIMLTAHSERSRVFAARDAGVTEFCCKPVTAADLLKRVSACIADARPFVRTGGYFGPDRRRTRGGSYRGADRRAARD